MISPDLHQHLAGIERLADVRERIARYRALLAKDPRWAVAWFNLVSDLIQAGEHDDARATLSRALATMPDGWGKLPEDLRALVAGDPRAGKAFEPGARIGTMVAGCRIVGVAARSPSQILYHAMLDGREVTLRMLTDRSPAAIRAGFERELAAPRGLPGLAVPRAIIVDDDGFPMQIYDRLSGVTLGERFPAGARLDPMAAIHAGHAIACALAPLHAGSMAHGALTPDNVLLDESDAAPRVTVLGTRRAAGDESGRTLQMSLEMVAWIAPEAGTLGPVRPQADVFTIGLLLHFMVTHKRPIGLSDRAGDARRAMPLLAPLAVGEHAHRATLLRSLDRVLDRCLAIDPEARLADASALADALARLDPTLLAGHRSAPPNIPHPLGAPPPAALPAAPHPPGAVRPPPTPAQALLRGASHSQHPGLPPAGSPIASSQVAAPSSRAVPPRSPPTPAASSNRPPGAPSPQPGWAQVVPFPAGQAQPAVALSAAAPTLTPAAIRPGVVLGKWRLGPRIGQGEFGAVHHAVHTIIEGHRAAVKLLHPHKAIDADTIRRFLNEASAASFARHENIVQVFDGEAAPGGLCYLAMELLEGNTLRQTLRLNGPLEFERVIRIAIQTADAFTAAHRIKVVHRDLKPDNVFLVERPGRPDFVKIFDFGIARLRDASESDPANRTRSGVIMGTPEYMSPEQWTGLSDIDGRTDIYALGIMLYECIVGRAPFSGNIYECMRQHMEEPVPHLPATTPAMQALDRLIQSMVAKRREERIGTMQEVLDRLIELAPPMPLTSSVRLPEYTGHHLLPSVTTAPVLVPSSWLRRRRPWLAAGVVLLVAGGGGALWLGRGADLAGISVESVPAADAAVSIARTTSVPLDASPLANDAATAFAMTPQSTDGGALALPTLHASSVAAAGPQPGVVDSNAMADASVAGHQDELPVAVADPAPNLPSTLADEAHDPASAPSPPAPSDDASPTDNAPSSPSEVAAGEPPATPSGIKDLRRSGSGTGSRRRKTAPITASGCTPEQCNIVIGCVQQLHLPPAFEIVLERAGRLHATRGMQRGMSAAVLDDCLTFGFTHFTPPSKVIVQRKPVK